jgi:hypothetical protein
VRDEAQQRLSNRAIRAIETLGSAQIRYLQYRGSWAMVGVKGTPVGSALESLNNNGPCSIATDLRFFAMKPKEDRYLKYALRLFNALKT